MKLIRPSFLAILMALPLPGNAVEYEWTFNNGTLSDAFGNGTMVPVGATTTEIINTNGGSIPHISGVPAQVLNVPQFINEADGFNVAFNGSTGNGGSAAYINQYTFLFDLYSPGAADWQALFQTNPNNPITVPVNDADWYISPDSALGIGATYSDAGAVPQETWHRIAFAADLTAGRMTFYVNGGQVAQFTGTGLFDQRWALFSNVDPGDDVRLFNEGDPSGIYTHAMYVNSIAFVDRELSGEEIGALGGAQAVGILVPEPGIGMLGASALLMGAMYRRPKRRS